LNRVYVILAMLFSIVLTTACNQTPNLGVPAIQNEDSLFLRNILSMRIGIEELYYEEVPLTSYYSGGIVIENTSKVWLKGTRLKTEQIIHFYKDNERIESETTGELYDYLSLTKKRYYLGDHPEQVNTRSQPSDHSAVIPRGQTILWYLDKIPLEINAFEEGEYAGEKCLIVEILKNNLGSTKVWIGTTTQLPVKIVNSYNGIVSERAYRNFKTGKGVISDEDLEIPLGAIQY